MYGAAYSQNTILREDFMALWPEKEWPKRGLTFISASREGALLWGNWLDGVGVGYSTYQECRVIAHWDDTHLFYREKYGTRCDHDYVNVSFNHVTLACKKCGVSK